MNDDVREEAALILAICASISPDGHSGLTYGEVCNTIDATDAAMFLAGRSWSDALRSLRERSKFTNFDAINDRHLVYAEAEALLRTGWEP